MAGLWQRFTLIFKSKASRALDRAENPTETLDYSYEQMIQQLQNVKRGVADVVTAKKRLELQTQSIEQNVVKLETQARQAVAANREDLARQALERKAAAQQQLQGLDAQVQQLQSQQEGLIASQQQLEAKIESFRSEKEVIKAQYSAAQAQVKIGEAATGIGRGMQDTGMAIQRARDKTEELQARASAIEELTASGALEDVTDNRTQLDRELSQISASGQVEDELAKLKAEVGPGDDNEGDRARHAGDVVGLGDVLFGRKKLKGPARDRLFALTTAAVSLDVECGLKPAGVGAVVFKPLSAGEFAQVDKDVEELLASVAASSGSTLERKTDTFGFEWVVVHDPDLEDQVTAVYAVAKEFSERGFGAQLLAAPFRFEGGGHPVYWIYGFKTGHVLAVRPDRREAGARQPARAAAEGAAREGAARRARPDEVVRLVRRADLATRNRLAHLAGDLRERREPLLERRVIHEELADLRAPVRRDDEEGVHRRDLAQVLLRDLRDPARDLLQRAHQVLGRAGHQRRAAVGRVLAVARDRADEDVADRVGDDRDREDDQPDRHAVVAVRVAAAAAAEAAEHAAVEADTREERRRASRRSSRAS